MLDSSEMLENRYFIINKRVLMLICLWPYQKKNLKSIVRIILVLTIHSMMIPQIIRALEEWHMDERDLQILVENFAGFLYFQAVLAKMYMSIYFEDELQTIYERIMVDWKEMKDEGERAVLHLYASTGRLLTIVYMVYTFTGGLFFVWMPVTVPSILDILIPLNESRPKVLCYFAEYYIDQQKYIYYLAFHTFICVSLTIIIIASVDSTYVSCVYHVIGLYKIIDYRMNKAFEFAQTEFPAKSKISDYQLHNYVIGSVKIHNKSIEFSSNKDIIPASQKRRFYINSDNSCRFANLIQASYSDCFFFVTGLVLLCLSVGSIDMILNLHNPVNFIRIGFLWLGIIMYLFYVSWPGQKLADSSYHLFESIYSSGWYNFPLKTRYLVKFMMMRCMIPCQLTAGPLLQMNFQNCGLVLRTALSYFTVVASFS